MFIGVQFLASNWHINHAFRIAMGDFLGNIVPYSGGLLKDEAPCIMAGLWYDNPWTRDAAINAWNGAALLTPAEARNTLLVQLHRDDQGRLVIGGQFWDAIVWTTGAWFHYLCAGDRELLALAHEATVNTLADRERNVMDTSYGLFRGGACFQDGICGYPQRYVELKFAAPAEGKYVPDEGYPVAPDVPLFALSTNCLYYSAYRLLPRIAEALGNPVDAAWADKAAALKQAINAHFWMPEKGHYKYLVDDQGGCDRQEGLGHSFALLLGVADDAQAAAVLKNQYVSEHGVPCVWPVYERFHREDKHAFSTHSGTVWPMVEGFWGEVAGRFGRRDLLARELLAWTDHIRRDNQCDEIYHPETGEKYGGLTNYGVDDIGPFGSASRQTWSATGYMRMCLMGVLGLRIDADGVRFEPCMPEGLDWVHVKNLPYRDALLDVRVEGTGPALRSVTLDGEALDKAFVPAGICGRRELRIALE